MSIRVFLSAGAALAVAGPVQVRGDVTYTVVAVQGQTAPGTGGFWAQFLGGVGEIGAPVLDDQGNVAFRAFLGGVSSASDTGIFAAPGAGSVAWAREGALLPDGSTTYAHNSSNQAGFAVLGASGAMIANVGSGVGGVIVYGPVSGPTTVHRPSQPAPGLPGVTLRTLASNPAVSPSGHYAFVSTLLGGGLDFREGLFSNHGGAMTNIAFGGGPVSGWPGSTYVVFGPATFSDSGAIAFEAMTSLGQAIMSSRGGTLAPIYKVGDAAPQMPGLTLASVRRPVVTTPNAPAMNAIAEVAFPAMLSNGVTAIFTDAGGAARPVAVTGQAMSGVPGAQWTSFNLIPSLGLSDEGDVVFFHRAWFSGFEFDGVFSERLGSLRIVARQGLPSPIAGLDYGPIVPTSVRVNASGLVAFVATLVGPGVHGGNDRALFVWAPADGEATVIVREGDAFDALGDGSSMRSIALFQFNPDDAANAFNPSPGRGGGHGAFNAAGALAFLLRFTDASEGVYVARLTSPCPADLTGSSDPNDPTYGVPDGAADAADFFYFLDQFALGNLSAADMTGSSDPGDPSYGEPDGVLDIADFFYFLDLFVSGCA